MKLVQNMFYFTYNHMTSSYDFFSNKGLKSFEQLLKTEAGILAKDGTCASDLLVD